MTMGGVVECMTNSTGSTCVQVKSQSACLELQKTPLLYTPLPCNSAKCKSLYGNRGGAWCDASLPYVSNAPWQCLPNVETPVRRVASGDVECMSRDGFSCVYTPTFADCVRYQLTPVTPLQPLVCGAMLKSINRFTGYDIPAHWCARAQPLLSKQPWKCVDGISTPVRRNVKGDVECMSMNGHDCVQGACEANLIVPVAPMNPLTCGAAHKTQWGITGYDDATHWCSIALKKLP
ncbi:hypothetical protein ACHHYP_13226 [Achlya hypogyna]|uniref:Uncharacterized protein n=1 Tax=Achlya hypogyna TaxID=1202772 RepID=A0A1V9YFV1_ACHHY|nr:hypothetical protein ACHHYP_13226 [Achlya hypogyna]